MISAIVVNWNGEDLLAECLAALTMDAIQIGAEVCVVDNGSTDGSVALIRSSFPNAILVENPMNGGFAAGVNSGIAATSGDIIVLVNNDAVVETGFLAALTRGLADPRTAAVTGCIVLADRRVRVAEGGLVAADGSRWGVSPDGQHGVTLVNSTGNLVTRSGNGQDRDWLTPLNELQTSSDPFGFSGGAVALRRAAIDDVGLFDQSLFMYYEDTDMSWRLRRRGWRIAYAADAIIRHRHAASSGTESENFIRWNSRNRILVAMRHGTAPMAMRSLAFGTAHALIDCRTIPGVRRALWLFGQLLTRAPSVVRDRVQVQKTSTVSRRNVLRGFL